MRTTRENEERKGNRIMSDHAIALFEHGLDPRRFRRTPAMEKPVERQIDDGVEKRVSTG